MLFRFFFVFLYCHCVSPVSPQRSRNQKNIVPEGIEKNEQEFGSLWAARFNRKTTGKIKKRKISNRSRIVARSSSNWKDRLNRLVNGPLERRNDGDSSGASIKPVYTKITLERTHRKFKVRPTSYGPSTLNCRWKLIKRHASRRRVTYTRDLSSGKLTVFAFFVPLHLVPSGPRRRWVRVVRTPPIQDPSARPGVFRTLQRQKKEKRKEKSFFSEFSK